MQQENTAPGGAADEAGSGPINEIEALLGEVERLRATVVGLKDETLRERAELDNQRKRLARDLDSARRFANERLLADLLPLFDAMEAGLASAASNDPLREGMELTLRQLHRIAEANGLAEVAPAPGSPFDPEPKPGFDQPAPAARPTSPPSCRCTAPPS